MQVNAANVTIHVVLSKFQIARLYLWAWIAHWSGVMLRRRHELLVGLKQTPLCGTTLRIRFTFRIKEIRS